MRPSVRQISGNVERVACRHVLGLTPDPETWPEPVYLDALPAVDGIRLERENIAGWVLDREFTAHWPNRRTAIGAQTYRFERNGEYECGWRLVDLADRFMRRKSHLPIDIVALVPPAPVFRPVPVLEWSGEKLARRLGASFRPDLFNAAAPLADHADRLRKLPVPWGELYHLERHQSVFNKRVLLLDWRWEKGKSMKALLKLLRDAGAEVVCFAWMA